MLFSQLVTAGTGNWGWVFAWPVTAGTGVNGLIIHPLCGKCRQVEEVTPRAQSASLSTVKYLMTLTVFIYPKTGKVQCDKGCVNWATYTMCSHTLAAAEKMGTLKEFLNWFKTKNHLPNLAAIANVNMPKNSGQKVGTRKRKGGSNKPSTVERNVFCNRVLQSTVVPTSGSSPCPSVFPYVSDQNTPPWPLMTPFPPVHHGHGFHVAETQAPVLCQQASAINTQPPFPQRPKPEGGILVLA